MGETMAEDGRRTECLRVGAAMVIDRLDALLTSHLGSGALVSDDLIGTVCATAGVAADEFEELFGEVADFEHELFSHILRAGALGGALDAATTTFNEGFNFLPSRAMEAGPRISFDASKHDPGFGVLLRLVIAGSARPDLLERCQDLLAEFDELWTAAPLLDSLALLGLDLASPFTPSDVGELFQLLLMGALLRDLISPSPDRGELLARGVQALFLGFTRDMASGDTLQARMDAIDARWPTFDMPDDLDS